MNSCALPYQANVSGKIRTILKREAAENGGLRDMARDIGENYHKVWNQMNRNQGVLADLVVILARHGFDGPLRIVAEAAGHEVIPKVKFLRKMHPGKSIRSFELDVHHAASALTMLVELALSDGALSSMEKEAIKEAAQKAKIEIAELEARMTGGTT
jgi:molybdenum-dependent DNA-binding transcriptional regulator ModE